MSRESRLWQLRNTDGPHGLGEFLTCRFLVAGRGAAFQQLHSTALRPDPRTPRQPQVAAGVPRPGHGRRITHGASEGFHCGAALQDFHALLIHGASETEMRMVTTTVLAEGMYMQHFLLSNHATVGVQSLFRLTSGCASVCFSGFLSSLFAGMRHGHLLYQFMVWNQSCK